MSLTTTDKILQDIPYARILNISAEKKDDHILFHLPFDAHFIGNYMIQAYHGGVLCSLLEIAASVVAREALQAPYMPKIINANYNFLKPALKNNDIFAKARIVKKGKRILSISASAYSEKSEDALTILHANFLNKQQPD